MFGAPSSFLLEPRQLPLQESAPGDMQAIEPTSPAEGVLGNPPHASTAARSSLVTSLNTRRQNGINNLSLIVFGFGSFPFTTLRSLFNKKGLVTMSMSRAHWTLTFEPKWLRDETVKAMPEMARQ